MKHTIILSVFMMIATLFAFGQRADLNSKRNFKSDKVERKFSESNRIINRIRSGHIFMNRRNAFKDSKYKSSQLVDKQRLDSLIEQTWDKTTQHWLDKWKDEFLYDSKNDLVSEYDYEWNPATSAWEFYNKYEFTYDSNHNLIQEINYEFDSNINQWTQGWKDEYIYDSNGNRIQYDEYNKEWNNYRKYLYSYDVNGNMIQELMYGWNQNLTSKIEYTYDSNGKLMQYLYHEMESGQWVVHWKGTFTYETNGNITQFLGFEWNESTGQWVDSTKNEYTYDSNGNVIKYMYYEWESAQWFAYWKGDFTYDITYSFSDLVLPNYFSDYNYLILPDYYSDYEYRTFLNDMLTNAINYEWDDTVSNLANSSNMDLYYSKQNSLSVSDISKSDFKVYPNPVTNNFTINSKSPIDKVEIYSVLGQRVKEINSDFNSVSTNFLARGIYMVKIYSDKGSTVKKLIKQ